MYFCIPKVPPLGVVAQDIPCWSCLLSFLSGVITFNLPLLRLLRSAVPVPLLRTLSLWLWETVLRFFTVFTKKKINNNLCLCRWIGLSAVVVMCPIVPLPSLPAAPVEWDYNRGIHSPPHQTVDFALENSTELIFVSLTKCVCLLSLLQCAHKITA